MSTIERIHVFSWPMRIWRSHGVVNNAWDDNNEFFSEGIERLCRTINLVDMIRLSRTWMTTFLFDKWTLTDRCQWHGTIELDRKLPVILHYLSNFDLACHDYERLIHCLVSKLVNEKHAREHNRKKGIHWIVPNVSTWQLNRSSDTVWLCVRVLP
jgi:hypothetical protein